MRMGEGLGVVAAAPFIAIGLVIASRFATSDKARALLCAASGLSVVGIVAYYTHWVVAVVCVGAACIAVGNRVGKEFSYGKTPRVLTGIGGLALVALFCTPMMGTTAISELFSGQSWSNGGWKFCLPLFALLVYACCAGLVLFN